MTGKVAYSAPSPAPRAMAALPMSPAGAPLVAMLRDFL